MRWSGIYNFPLAEDAFTFVIAVVSDLVAFYVFLVPEAVASGKVVSATKDKVADEVAAFPWDPGFRKIQNQIYLVFLCKTFLNCIENHRCSNEYRRICTYANTNE